MRHFNTTGPVVAVDHYLIPPLQRFDLGEVLALIGNKKYFVLHAPRQSGKTSALVALRDLLNSSSDRDYRCVYASVEEAATDREDTAAAMKSILGALASKARRDLGDTFVGDVWQEMLQRYGSGRALAETLCSWAEADSRPLVLLIDEIDALVGDTLLSVLRQLRAGYPDRPSGFPHSIVLCGMRDLRDYRIQSGSKGKVVASPFNISAKSLRLGDFSRADVAELLGQHTSETGQAFETGAIERVWAQTQGQPWLVNALCAEACFRKGELRHPRRSIREADIVQAQEELILQRSVHLDQLADKLTEDRVRRVIEPILGGSASEDFSVRDFEYVRDLGLVAVDDPLRIANPIYAEVVPRELTFTAQRRMVQDSAWFVLPDGGLDAPRLMGAFQEFFRENSEHWIERFKYKEAGPQLLLQAYLQRIVNGGGRIEREYGLGRGRTDLLLVWPTGQGTQRFVIECKILRGSLERAISDGVQQTAQYMDRCAAASGHLVIFHRREGGWNGKVFRRREHSPAGPVDVWGM